MEDTNFLSVEAGFSTLWVWTLNYDSTDPLDASTGQPSLQECVWKAGNLSVSHAKEVK